jgi:hypothetical protein
MMPSTRSTVAPVGGMSGSRVLAAMKPLAAKTAFTGPGFASTNIASCTGKSRWCARNASVPRPSRARRTTSLTLSG